MKIYAIEYNTMEDSFNVGYFRSIEAAMGEQAEYIKYLNESNKDLSKLKLNGESPDVFACTGDEYLEGKFAWVYIDIVSITSDKIFDSTYNEKGGE